MHVLTKNYDVELKSINAETTRERHLKDIQWKRMVGTGYCLKQKNSEQAKKNIAFAFPWEKQLTSSSQHIIIWEKHFMCVSPRVEEHQNGLFVEMDNYSSVFTNDNRVCFSSRVLKTEHREWYYWKQTGLTWQKQGHSVIQATNRHKNCPQNRKSWKQAKTLLRFVNDIVYMVRDKSKLHQSPILTHMGRDHCAT